VIVARGADLSIDGPATDTLRRELRS